MKVFTNNLFEGFYPVGTAAVVIAEDKQDAARLLSNALSDTLLCPDVNAGDMIEIDTTEESCVILCDGSY